VIDDLERRAVSGKKLPVRFKKADTIEESGKRLEVGRSYDFDKEQINLLLIAIHAKQF
jgi:hypothetical protein